MLQKSFYSYGIGNNFTLVGNINYSVACHISAAAARVKNIKSVLVHRKRRVSMTEAENISFCLSCGAHNCVKSHLCVIHMTVGYKNCLSVYSQGFGRRQHTAPIAIATHTDNHFILKILFYLWIMEDLFFTRKIAYDPSGKSNTIRDLNRVYDLAQAGISKLHGVLLTDKLHPYIDNRVIDFINKTNQESRILLSVQMYKPRITVKLL